MLSRVPASCDVGGVLRNDIDCCNCNCIDIVVGQVVPLGLEIFVKLAGYLRIILYLLRDFPGRRCVLKPGPVVGIAGGLQSVSICSKFSDGTEDIPGCVWLAAGAKCMKFKGRRLAV